MLRLRAPVHAGLRYDSIQPLTLGSRILSRRSLTPSSPHEVADFLRRARSLQAHGAARLLFAMDATASREATWDHAAQVQAAMFAEATQASPLQVQLAWYGGLSGFHHSDWVTDAAALRATMERVRCAAGATQFGRVLRHAAGVAREGKLAAVVFVGDCMEENPRALYDTSGQLRLFNVPVFIFQEGKDPIAARAFAEIARVTRGAHLAFGSGSASELRDLLRGVAAYADEIAG